MKAIFDKQFGPEEIEKFKQTYNERDARLGNNRLKKSVDTRWVGIPGEYTLGFYLKQVRGLTRNKDFEYLGVDKEVDDIDFIVGEQKIDVKTVARTTYPREDYACDVTEGQYKKIIANKCEVNCFVFCSYNTKNNMCSLLGWMSRKEFMEKAVYIPEQTTLNTMTANTAMYEVYVKDLHNFDDGFFPVKEVKKKTLECYLEGCKKPADPDLTAFCCAEHKEEYWGKSRPAFERKEKLTIPQIQERLKDMKSSPPSEDIVQAAKDIFGSP